MQSFQAFCERTLSERRHAFAAIRYSRGAGQGLPRELIQRVLAYACEIPWHLERTPAPLGSEPLSTVVRVCVWLGKQLVLEHPMGGRGAKCMVLEGPRSEDGRRMTVRCSLMHEGVDLWVGEVYDDPGTLPWTHYSAFRELTASTPMETPTASGATTVRVTCSV